MWFTYILECKDKSLYTGVTNDVARRFLEHQQKKGAKYTKAKGAVKIVYTEECATRSLALKREFEIKQLTKAQKENLFI